MKRLFVSGLLFLCAAAGFAQQTITYPNVTTEGAGSSTCTMTQALSPTYLGTGRGQTTWTFAWTSSSGGAMTVVTPWIDGWIALVTTKPGTGGTTPSAYSVTFKNARGSDLFVNKGASRSTTAIQDFVPLKGDGVTTASLVALNGPITVGITGGGSGKTGTLDVIINH